MVGKVMDNWEETLYSSYISMLFNEVLTFVIMFVLFRKKADFVRKEKRNGSWLPVLGMFIFPLIQIGNDLMTLVHGKKVFSLLELTKRIGLMLTDTCEMVPTKSVTAFIGID